MKWIAKLNRPWLHFILLGAVFYQLQGALFPEPKPVIGPLSESRIEALQQQWEASTGQQLTPENKARLIEVELNGDVLLQRALELDIHLYDKVIYQRLIRNMNFLQLAQGKPEAELFKQALEMRLHLDDTIVKRRLIQVMEQKLLADNLPSKPSAAEIKTEFENRFKELRRAPIYSIEHIFFNREREPEVTSIVATIKNRKLDIEAARYLSSPFLQGYQFTRQTPRQLANSFGKDFVLTLEQAEPIENEWLGLIRSAFGLHYVWVSDFEPSRDARLEEVEEKLRKDLTYEAQAQALKAAIVTLREDYDVRGLDVAARASKTKEARQ